MLAGTAAVLLLIAAAADPVPACAQAHRWAVLSSAGSPEDLERAGDAADHARAALEAQGETVLARERAVARIESGFSRRFTPAPDPLVARLASVTESVLEHVAFGRTGQALDLGDPTLDELEQHIVALGRADASRDVANLCLYLVRAELAAQRRDMASQRVDRCLRLVPGLDPDERLHPPDVRDLVRGHRRALDATESGGVLSVQTTSSDREGCTVRVNGAIVGRSPWVRLALPPGSYGVQVECTAGTPARVFTALVEEGAPTRITVPGALAAALETSSSAIALRYGGAAELAQRIGTDVATLGRILEVERVLVSVIDGGAATLRAFELGDDATARLVGSAAIPEPIDEAASRDAVASVRAGRQASRVASIPASADPGESSPSAGPDVGIAVLGGSFLTVGVAGLGIGWYFWSELESRGRTLDRAATRDELEQGQIDFDEARVPVLILGAAGGALSAAGAAFLVSTSGEYDVPWWSWIFGATGLGVGAVGVYLMTTDGACHGNVAVGEICARQTPTWLLGTFVLEHAASFLAVPITHLIRAVIGNGRSGSTSASLRVDAERATLSIHGSF